MCLLRPPDARLGHIDCGAALVRVFYAGTPFAVANRPLGVVSRIHVYIHLLEFRSWKMYVDKQIYVDFNPEVI